MATPDQYRDVMVKVIVEDDDHCSVECEHLEGDEVLGICIFGCLSLDKKTGTFTRHCECRMAER